MSGVLRQLPGVVALLTLLAFLSGRARAESHFLLVERERSPEHVVLALVHNADDSSTPTAGWAPLVIRAKPASAVLDGITVNEALAVRGTAIRPEPIGEGEDAGHELRLLFAAGGAGTPDSVLPGGIELVRFRMRLRDASAGVQVRADSLAGGLRGWDGRAITPPGPVLADWPPALAPDGNGRPALDAPPSVPPT